MSLPAALSFGLLAALGYAAWGLVEYLVHGVLAHRLRSFVSPLHGAHHADPRRVFTSPIAWAPVALLLWLGGSAIAGPLPAGGVVLGLLAGFLHYEYVHWRFHFREPRSPRERRLRAHHLAHHYRRPRSYYGVSTSLWDAVFGSLPESREADYQSVATLPPLEGASNLRASYSLRGMRDLLRGGAR